MCVCVCSVSVSVFGCVCVCSVCVSVFVFNIMAKKGQSFQSAEVMFSLWSLAFYFSLPPSLPLSLSHPPLIL